MGPLQAADAAVQPQPPAPLRPRPLAHAHDLRRGGTPTPARLSVLVCAYNEEANIGGLLRALLADDPEGAVFDDLIVVSSASTDGTDAIVSGLAAEEPRLRLLREPERRGKVAAVNAGLAFLQHEVVALVDADCLPGAGALARLAAWFDDPTVGGVGTHNLPLNPDESFVARVGALMWDLHHRVNLVEPVLGGDAVAFRRCFEALPETAVNDDFAVETELRRRGLRVVYDPDAVTRMRVPATLPDFLAQRRRVHAGYRLERRAAGRLKSTQQPALVLRAAVGLLRERPGALPLLLALLAFDSLARALGYLDAVRGRADRHRRWQPVLSTKGRLQA